MAASEIDSTKQASGVTGHDGGRNTNVERQRVLARQPALRQHRESSREGGVAAARNIRRREYPGVLAGP
jgi:hypothetical protein